MAKTIADDQLLKKGDTLPSNTIEMPPNKAYTAGGSAGISSVIVGLALHYFAPDTPPEIVGLWNAMAGTIIGFLTVYFVPHGAMMKP